jgi:hypothetical protein
MEKGFFHPNRGYWQTISEPSPSILATYPRGTVSVPLKPRDNCEWDGFAWVDVEPPAPTREEQEALRKAAYVAESDPLMAKMLRGDATKEEWLAKIDEIKARYPYPNEL